jgi:AcrR family transcriptional regulator
MVRLTRAQSQAQTRRRLLEAAAVVFARRSFHGASLEEVADEAGYTKGAVYSNFGSKDELFLAVLEDRLQAQVNFFGQLAEQAQAQPDGDLARLMPRLDGPDEVWCLLEFEFWLYALRHPPMNQRVAALYRQYRAQLAPLAAPYASDGLEPEEVVSAAIALYHGLTLQGHSDPAAIRPDLVSRVLVALERGAARPEDRARAPDARAGTNGPVGDRSDDGKAPKARSAPRRCRSTC